MIFRSRRGISLIVALAVAFSASTFGSMGLYGVPQEVQAAEDTVTVGKEVSTTLNKGGTWTLKFTPSADGKYTLLITPSATSSSATSDSPKAKIVSGSSTNSGTGAIYQINVSGGPATDLSAGRNYITLNLTKNLTYSFILTLTEITGTGSSTSSGTSSGTNTNTNTGSSTSSGSIPAVTVDGIAYDVLPDGTIVQLSGTTTKSSKNKDDDDDDDDDKDKDSDKFNSNGDVATGGSGKTKADYTRLSSSTVRYQTAEISSGATEAEVPATVKIKSKTYKVTEVDTNAFSGFDKLNKVTIGSNVKKLKAGSLGNAKSLKVLKVVSTQISKSGAKGCLKNSSVSTVYVPIGRYSTYKKVFTKSNTGSKNSFILKSYGSKKPKSSSTGKSSSGKSSSGTASRASSGTYILNNSSKIFHKSDCSVAARIPDSSKETYTGKRQDVIDKGFKACASCHP